MADALVESKLTDFRAWSVRRTFSRCRLVQYVGVDLVGGADVPLEEVEVRIANLSCEGFYVDWADHQGALFLRVWEFNGPEPEWPKVFTERL